MWCKMVKVSKEKLADGSGQFSKEFYEAKIETAKFFMARMLPESDARFKMVLAGAEPLMSLKVSGF